MDVATLQVLAANVIESVCRNTHWLGLERDDLVAEGWLGVQAARSRVDAAKGDPETYLRNAAWHAMRAAAFRWYGIERVHSPRVKQVYQPLQFVQVDDISTLAVVAIEHDDDAPEPTLNARALLEQLTPQNRAIVEAIYRDGLTPKEIAARLEIPVSRVHRARYRSVETLRALAGRPTDACIRQRERVVEWHQRNLHRVREAQRRYDGKRSRESVAANTRAYRARQKAKQAAPPALAA